MPKYKKEGYIQDKDLDNLDDLLESELKWSHCDSPRHEDYYGALKDAEKILLDAQGMDELMEEKNYIEFDLRITEICMDVLAQLDAEGIFKSLDRSSFALNLLAGDQSEEERLARAKVLNVFHTYKSDIAKVVEGRKQLY